MKNLLYVSLLLLTACGEPTTETTTEESTSNKTYATTGSIERMEAALDDIVPVDAKIEILADGFTWSEGPVWIPELNSVVFSDVPENKAWRWSEADSLQLYLEPSGMTDPEGRSREPGSNGLMLNAAGQLILCQHGNRQVARMDAPLDAPEPNYVTLTDNWEGQRYNSPNDLDIDSEGNVYFTDPPYGLKEMMQDTAKDMSFQGVFRLNVDGSVDLLVDSITRPNGIGLSPDESKLYVANSDPEKAYWLAYDITEEGMLANVQTLYDATELVGKDNEAGLPDGFVVSAEGHLFATGPGGVWVFAANGQPLGKIRTGVPTANCTLDTNEATLYITANNYLMRVKL